MTRFVKAELPDCEELRDVAHKGLAQHIASKLESRYPEGLEVILSSDNTTYIIRRKTKDGDESEEVERDRDLGFLMMLDAFLLGVECAGERIEADLLLEKKLPSRVHPS